MDANEERNGTLLDEAELLSIRVEWGGTGNIVSKEEEDSTYRKD